MPDKLSFNFDLPASGVDGTPILDKEPVQGGKQITWKWLAQRAVATRYQDEASMDWDKSLKRGRFAQRLGKEGITVLSSDEVVELKKLFAKCWPPDYVAGFGLIVEGEGS